MVLDPTLKEEPRATEQMLRRERNRWHAVIITGPNSACAAAKACKGKRFLSAEVPLLPLAGCTSVRCECKYRHFDDRRSAPRRREEVIGVSASAGRADSERRKKGGRRTTD